MIATWFSGSAALVAEAFVVTLGSAYFSHWLAYPDSRSVPPFER